MLAQSYFMEIHRLLEEVERTQREPIARTAQLIADATEQGKCVYAFGASHAGILAQELFYRTGGLVTINPILPPGLTLDVRPVTMTSSIERIEGYGRTIADSTGIAEGDVLIVHSVSGRNSVSIDMAIRARELGASVVALTNMAYSSSVSSRHSSGKRLYEVCDLVIDNCGRYGDAALEVANFAERVAPTSTVVGAAILNAIVAEVVDTLVKRGVRPPVFMSANVDGGDEFNRAMLEAYAAQIRYM